MGCAASVLLLQAFRSALRRNCAHICPRRLEQLSQEPLPPDARGAASRAPTVIVMGIVRVNALLWGRWVSYGTGAQTRARTSCLDRLWRRPIFAMSLQMRGEGRLNAS
ncbi:hypothetical protein AAFF_G00130970 [Aldrovandia affinis]|uniref:Uncharacterized protein n=1 Tax=Aldrovandia affinis TaxID=143900 RepID=A0AAD7RQS0_9TELE|nr:hypothetical protein AAFF_G00130970 [Aldrovandia affinis]